MSSAYSPMAILSLAAQQDKSKLASADAYILLLDMIWNGEHTRLVRNPSAVQFDAGDGLGIQTYQPFSFELDIQQPGGNQLPTIHLHASNVLGLLQSLIEAYAGLAGATCNLYVMNTAQPAGEPAAAFSTTVISSSSTAEIVTFSLSGPSPMRQLFPLFLYRGDVCMWVTKYKGKQCGYKGALTSCDGTYAGANGCTLHDNTIRYGAFPGIGTNGIVIASAMQ